MKTVEIAEKISSEHDLPKGKVKKILDAFLETVTATAAGGDEVNLTGFGKFKIQDRPEREGRNPGTGETIQIAASKTLSFLPAKAIKERLNQA